MGIREYVFYLLWQTSRHRDLAIEEMLEPIGLNMPGWRALAVVRRLRDCTMKVLSRYSSIDRTTLTRTIDQLVGHEMIERRTPAQDRRQVQLDLSAKGSDCYDDAIRRVMGLNVRLIEGIDEADLKTTARVLQQVLKTLVREEALADELLTFGWPKPAAAQADEAQAAS